MTDDPSPSETIDRFLPLAPRDVLILLSLGEGPQHGYGLIKSAEELSEGRVRMDPANLYRALRKLGRDGLVRESAAPAGVEPDGPPRRYHAITRLGRAVVAAETERLARLAAIARERDLLSSSGS